MFYHFTCKFYLSGVIQKLIFGGWGWVILEKEYQKFVNGLIVADMSLKMSPQDVFFSNSNEMAGKGVRHMLTKDYNNG